MPKRRATPSVKIPKRVIEREANRKLKLLLKKEREKEKKSATREKIKLKAKHKLQRTKDAIAYEDEIYGESFQIELWGVGCIGLGIAFLAIYFGSADISRWLTTQFTSLLGVMRWLLPVGFIALGGGILIRRPQFLPTLQVAGVLVFLLSLVGLVHLASPYSEMLAQASHYGGAVGFAVTVFLRKFFGDLSTGLLLLLGLWGGAMFGFHFRLSDVLRLGHDLLTDLFQSQPADTTTSKNSRRRTSTEENPDTVTEDTPSVTDPDTSPKKHFTNQLQIVDSTKSPDTPPAPQSVDLQPVDPLTEAKNKHFTAPWQPPSIDLLRDNPATITVDEVELRRQAEVIREKLEQFGILVEMRSVHVGPTVTQFTLEPAAGVKLTKITSLKNDLALALAATSLRIEAPIRGKSLVGIEIPNADRAVVGAREILTSTPWRESQAQLRLAVGRDVAGKPIVIDLAKMPHLLIAGKTGSGKSVAMNAFLCSLLWQNSPDDLKLILVDPKRVELSLYNNLPHLLTPVIVEPEKSVSALAWAVAEMNRRYKRFAEARCRNISEYNEKFKDEGVKEPFIVIVIDELADLMMVAGKDVEAAICRIAQMARAVGMHLMIATQRPSVDVVTGLIKANLPARIAFRVSSGIDSRTIIDGVGAEDLLGFGDMLALDGNSGDLTRIQGIYISNEEVERITNHIKLQFPEMIANDEITSQSIEGMAKGGVLTAGTETVADADLDPLYEDAVKLIIETGKASASFMQRRLEIGYARAARILDQMEKRGVIGPSRGAKPREVYGVR